MTAQEIKDAGFRWPVETEIENYLGEKRRVKPSSLKDGFDTATKRQREDLRLYNDGYPSMNSRCGRSAIPQ